MEEHVDVGGTEKGAGNKIENATRNKQHKSFVNRGDNDNDILPKMYQHARLSKRKVRDGMYKAFANLSDERLSIMESMKALIEVTNTCFHRKWKDPLEESNSFDVDTMPHRKNIREIINMLEAQSLDLLVERWRKGRSRAEP